MSYFRQALAISKHTRKSVWSQFQEIVSLRFFHNKLGPSEYYLYKLYDDRRHSLVEKKEFVGWRHSTVLDKALNCDQWRIFANDKVAFYSIMEANGMAYPRVAALFDDRGRQLKNAVPLHTEAATRAYLGDPAIYPLFIKPVSGTYGRGAFSAVGYDLASDSLQLGDGELRPVAAIIKMLQLPWTRGYLFQTLLQPHPEVAAVVGQRLSSLRVIVVLGADGPKIFRAVWKLPVGKNMSDNFMHGETGNLIANVDLKTGCIVEAVTGRGNSIVAVERHPDTQVALAGLAVPLWQQVVRYVSAGAVLFPGLKMQHWDIALCPEGPVALEVNVEGSLDLHQIAGRKGIFDGELSKLLQAN